MVEVVFDNEQEKLLKNILYAYYELSYNDFRIVYDNIQNNIQLGIALYDSGFIGELSNIPRDFFIANFDTIFSFYSGGGSEEGYINYFKSLFGINTVIEFDRNTPNFVLKLLVTTDLKQDFLVTENGDFLVTENGDKIIAVSIFDNATESQVLAVLELIKPQGIILEVEIQKQ